MSTRRLRGSCAVPALVLLAGLLSGLTGCSRQVRIHDVRMTDRSGYHYEMGCRHLESGRHSEALAHFDSGVRMAPADPRFHSKRAIALAMAGERRGALKAARQARRESRNDCAAMTATGRVHLILGETRDAVRWLERAAKKCSGDAVVHRWLAAAYVQADRDEEAGRAYWRAMELDPSQYDVEREWRAYQERNLARSGKGMIGGIAMSPRPTRAQLAAILIAELGVDRFMDRRTSVLAPGRLQEGPPAYVREQRRREISAAPDIAGHWAREAIVAAVECGIMDLEPGGTFNPDDAVTRKEFARVAARAMAAFLGHGAATGLLDHAASPFEDVSGFDPDFGPIMLATTRGVLFPRRPGFFEPQALVTGAEMTSALRALKETWTTLEGVM